MVMISWRLLVSWSLVSMHWGFRSLAQSHRIIGLSEGLVLKKGLSESHENSGIILGIGSANERQHYIIVRSSLIDWARA